MSTDPAGDSVPGVITFTVRGNAALDQLADALVAECNGSPTSIADLLEQVLEAEIVDLATSLNRSAPPAPPVSFDVDELRPPAESPNDVAASPALDGSPCDGGNPVVPGRASPPREELKGSRTTESSPERP